MMIPHGYCVVRHRRETESASKHKLPRLNRDSSQDIRHPPLPRRPQHRAHVYTHTPQSAIVAPRLCVQAKKKRTGPAIWRVTSPTPNAVLFTTKSRQTAADMTTVKITKRKNKNGKVRKVALDHALNPAAHERCKIVKLQELSFKCHTKLSRGHVRAWVYNAVDAGVAVG